MKSRLPILLGTALFIAIGAFTATRGLEPPKDGSQTTKDSENAKESKGDSTKETSKTKNSTALSQSKKMTVPFNKLTREEEHVILGKGTEAQNRGYTNSKLAGTYICKRCNAPLYNSTDKFESHCGWPSFDSEIKGAVKRQLDKDGVRIEIVCKNCDGHLGHVFEGERYTAKNTRHCVNSISMRLIPKDKELPKVIRADGSETEPETKTELESKNQSEKKDGSEVPLTKPTK
jgi:methionine-R-sulfoxide reductase